MKKVESLYIHFPYCRHLCNYCDFFKSKIDVDSHDYSSFENSLVKYFEVNHSWLHENGFQMKELSTIYFGGGTPSLWGERGAKFFKDFFHNKYSFAEGYEFSIEVNPGSWTERGVKSWLDAGVNRFSIGVQSTNQDFIKYLDRVHDRNEVFRTLEFFEKLNCNYSVDFMLGLPFSDVRERNIESELREILPFGPSHLSLYILTVGKSYKHYSNLPSDQYIESEFNFVSEFLARNNFEHYEVSNFALKGKQSQHNLKYWDNDSVAAVGPSATGFLRFENQAIRYKWMPSEQIKFNQETLNSSELQLEDLYLSLRTSKGINLSTYKNNSKDLGVLNDWVSRGLASVQNEKFILNSKGFLIMDSLVEQLG